MAIDKILEVEYEIRGEWLEQLSMTRLRAEQSKFLTAKKTKLADIAILHYSYQDREKAAKDYTAQLRKLSKKSAFSYVDAAIKHADLIHFTRVVSLKKRLARKLGIKDFVTFIDQLTFPIAQHHAFLFVNDLDDYVKIIREICSRTPRKTAKEYLFYTLKNYFDFIRRTLSDLEHLKRDQSHYSAHRSKEVSMVRREAKVIFEEWKSQRIKASFDLILADIFPKTHLSTSKFFVPFFDWLNSYSKLHLTHPAANSQRELIDLLNEAFQERLDTDPVSYHYLADQLPQGNINQEGLKKLVSVLSVNPGDAAFLDKLYHNYLTHLNSADFRWHADGNVDNMEAINQAYFFSQVLCAYPDAEARWQTLFQANRVMHEGWLPSPSDLLRHQREAYLLNVGVGIAHFRYVQNNPVQATTTLFRIVDIILKQMRSAYDRNTIDYETALWFAGATIARFANTERDRFIVLICHQVDSLKVFLRVVYEFLYNSESTNLFVATRALITERLQNEFFIIESSKVDADLKHDLGYYQQLKHFIENKLADKHS